MFMLDKGLRSVALAALVPLTVAQVEAAPKRLSLGLNGEEANGTSGAPAFSADGRFIAFQSDATNLVPGDTNGVTDVFVVSRRTGKIERVSLGRKGAEANGICMFPMISGDGRYVTFTSDASNLVPGDTNGTVDIFVYDRFTRRTTRVSVASNGSEANGGGVFSSISPDGRFVAFQSDADNLVPGDTNGFPDVFLHDRVRHTTIRVSVDSNGNQGNGVSALPDGQSLVSAYGRDVAFVSTADNLVPGDTNSTGDIFVRDIGRGITSRASVATGGGQADGPNGSFQSSISANGRFVAFYSDAPNLGVPRDITKVFVRDRKSNTTAMVSPADDLGYSPIEISANGRFAAFTGSQGNRALFVRDLRTNAIYEPDLTLSSDPAPQDITFNYSISGDGRWIAFASASPDIVPGDTNGVGDIFVVER